MVDFTENYDPDPAVAPPEPHLVHGPEVQGVTRRARPQPPAFAALDLGTNNCRLLIGTPQGDGFRVLDSFSRIVRLGEGLQHSGELGDAAMERAIAALQGCAARLARRPVRRLRAIATEACRQAGNAAAFLDRVRSETGLAIDVISTREEAELAVESCAPLLQARPQAGGRRALLFDIGGGSTELAWVRLPQAEMAPGGAPPEMIAYLSVPVGVVTVAEQFAASGGFDATVAGIAARLQEFEAVHRIGQEIRQGGVRLLGTSGTVTTLASMALQLPRYTRQAVDGVVMTAAQAQAAVAELRVLGRDGMDRHPCIGPERAEFVLPGCAIFAAIHAVWPASEIIVADRGLREGMLLRMIRAEREGGPRVERRQSWRQLAGLPLAVTPGPA